MNDGFRFAQPILRAHAPRHCERSEAVQRLGKTLDCFVAALLAMTVGSNRLPTVIIRV
jgi:hypothetical protein